MVDEIDKSFKAVRTDSSKLLRQTRDIENQKQ